MAIPNPNPNIADGVKSDVTTYSSNKIESLIQIATELPIPAAGDAGKVLTVNAAENGYELDAIPDELPIPAAGDAGKVLSVNTSEDGYELESLADVATTGAYSDISGTPTLATVATSGDYTDLINKPDILKTLDIRIEDLNVTVPAGTLRDAIYNTDISSYIPSGATLKAVCVRYISNACGITKQYCNDATHISIGVCNPTNADISVTAVDVTLFYI